MENKRNGIMVLLASHCVYDPLLDLIYAEHIEDRPIYEAHLAYAFSHLRWVSDEKPLLIISGGFTKIQ